MKFLIFLLFVLIGLKQIDGQAVSGGNDKGDSDQCRNTADVIEKAGLITFSVDDYVGHGYYDLSGFSYIEDLDEAITDLPNQKPKGKKLTKSYNALAKAVSAYHVNADLYHENMNKTVLFVTGDIKSGNDIQAFITERMESGAVSNEILTQICSLLDNGMEAADNFNTAITEGMQNVRGELQQETSNKLVELIQDFDMKRTRAIINKITKLLNIENQSMNDKLNTLSEQYRLEAKAAADKCEGILSNILTQLKNILS